MSDLDKHSTVVRNQTSCENNEHLPLITVMIPCYNNARFISDAIGSVLSQSYCNLEVLVCDDCSSDNSREILDSFQDDRIRVLKNPKNQRIAAVRNRLLGEARGEWVTSLDGDDLYVDDEKIMKEWQVASHDAVCRTTAFSDFVLMDQSGRHLATASQQSPVRQGKIFQSLLDRECMIPRDYLVATSIARSLGGFDEDLPIFEDFDFKLRLAMETRFQFAGSVGIGYRRHGHGLSNCEPRIHREILSRIRRRHGNVDDSLNWRSPHPMAHITPLLNQAQPRQYFPGGFRDAA